MGTSSTREQLLEVGLERLRSTGYTSTGVKDILDVAGVPKGSFYHYFPSKEAFASEVFQRYAEGEVRRLERVLGDRKVAPLKRLRRYFEELIAVYGQSGSTSGCLVGSMSLEVADHSQKLQTQLQTIFGVLRQSTQSDALAEFLLNSYEGALVRMKAEKSDKPLENFLHFIFDVLLKK